MVSQRSAHTHFFKQKNMRYRNDKRTRAHSHEEMIFFFDFFLTKMMRYRNDQLTCAHSHEEMIIFF